jgi:hypothetical protein
MPRSTAFSDIPIGQRKLVDAKSIGMLIGFTAQYVNRLAAAGKIPWHGVRNGAKVYRRFDRREVLDALKHDVGVSDCPPPKKQEVVSREMTR